MSEANYTISDLETLSGIKAHTIRIWEKRYHIISPSRSNTNIRFYSNDDLKLLLNISFLNKNDFKISKIAEMNPQEISEKVSSINIVKSSSDDYIDNLIVSMIDLNEAYFEKIFSSALFRIGFEKAITEVIFPFLQRIGLMWQTGSINPAQEHFTSNLIRQKLIVAIDSLPKTYDEKAPKAILFLPEKELHENSLLLYNYILKSKGYQTFYFGQTVPTSDLKRILKMTAAKTIICVITSELKEKDFATLMGELQQLSKNRKILLSGRMLVENPQKLPKHIHLFKNETELKQLI